MLNVLNFYFSQSQSKITHESYLKTLKKSKIVNISTITTACYLALPHHLPV